MPQFGTAKEVRILHKSARDIVRPVPYRSVSTDDYHSLFVAIHPEDWERQQFLNLAAVGTDRSGFSVIYGTQGGCVAEIEGWVLYNLSAEGEIVLEKEPPTRGWATSTAIMTQGGAVSKAHEEELWRVHRSRESKALLLYPEAGLLAAEPVCRDAVLIVCRMFESRIDWEDFSKALRRLFGEYIPLTYDITPYTILAMAGEDIAASLGSTSAALAESGTAKIENLWSGAGSLDDAIATLLIEGLDNGVLNARKGAAVEFAYKHNSTSLSVLRQYGFDTWRAAMKYGAELDILNAVFD